MDELSLAGTKPTGIEIAGWPVASNGEVLKVRPSACCSLSAGPWSFVACLGAAKGVVGVISTSNRIKS